MHHWFTIEALCRCPDGVTRGVNSRLQMQMHVHMLAACWYVLLGHNSVSCSLGQWQKDQLCITNVGCDRSLNTLTSDWHQCGWQAVHTPAVTVSLRDECDYKRKETVTHYIQVSRTGYIISSTESDSTRPLKNVIYVMLTLYRSNTPTALHSDYNTEQSLVT